jgi:hypothetical protein
MNRPEKVWPLLKHSHDPRVSISKRRFTDFSATSLQLVRHAIRVSKRALTAIRREVRTKLHSWGRFHEKLCRELIDHGVAGDSGEFRLLPPIGVMPWHIWRERFPSQMISDRAGTRPDGGRRGASAISISSRFFQGIRAMNGKNHPLKSAKSHFFILLALRNNCVTIWSDEVP